MSAVLDYSLGFLSVPFNCWHSVLTLGFVLHPFFSRFFFLLSLVFFLSIDYCVPLKRWSRSLWASVTYALSVVQTEQVPSAHRSVCLRIVWVPCQGEPLPPSPLPPPAPLFFFFFLFLFSFSLSCCCCCCFVVVVLLLLRFSFLFLSANKTARYEAVQTIILLLVSAGTEAAVS